MFRLRKNVDSRHKTHNIYIFKSFQVKLVQQMRTEAKRHAQSEAARAKEVHI